MIIRINNKNIELKSSLRAMMIYEKIQGESFSPKYLGDIIIYFYSTILASDKNLDLTLDDFIDYLDKNQDLLQQFSEFVTRSEAKRSSLSNKSSVKEGEEVDPKKC